ncbi:MAG: type 4b pilus protein PilO2 [Alphaproteobacteria bacterium]|nr:type 4b pilus protein PilO2 [Alphaproteobacteria bacterium]
MGNGVATIGRRKYATGLYWQISPSGRIVVAAKEAARQPGQYSDFFSIRPGNKTGRVGQFGLGTSESGHRAGMPTLAATLANRQPGSWAGAFKIREGVYVVIVRDDLIAPDGDQLYADEAEARNRLYQEINLGGLQRVYAPEAWAIPGSDGMSLALLLQDRAEFPLRPVVLPRSLIVGGVIGAVLLAVLLAGGLYWQHMQAEQERERMLLQEAQKRAQAQANQQLPSQLQPVQINYPPPVRYWEKEPGPLELVEACRVAMSQVSMAQVGWDMSEVRCNRGGLTVTWARLPGFAADIKGAIVDVTGRAAVTNIELTGIQDRGDQNLAAPTFVTRKFLTESWDGTLNRDVDDPPPPRPPEIPAEQWNPPPPPWTKRLFSIAVDSLPGELSSYFGNLPGVIIRSLTFNGGNWTVEGVIYENRE